MGEWLIADVSLWDVHIQMWMLFVFAIFLFGFGDIFGERRFLLRCYLVYDRRPYLGRFDGATGGNAECAARAHSITRGATG